MTSYRARIKTLLLAAAALLALAPSALADRKDDLYAKGMQALKDGKAVDARDAFCEAARLDSEYKDAQKQCDEAKKAADRVINQNNQRYADALKNIDEGNLDAAESKLKLVKYGNYVKAAQDKLAEIARIKQDRLKSQQAETDLKNRYDQGVAAWNNGKLDVAKNAFSGLTNSRYSDDAKDYLAKIDRYQSLLQQGADYESKKNYSAAANSYNMAWQINPQGPGNPSGKVDEMNRALAAASAPTVAPPQPSPAKKEEAVKAEVEQVDEGKLIQQAKALAAKGKYAEARRLLNRVLGQNLKNREARQALDALPQEAPATASAANVNQEDPVLAAAIREYYKGNFEDAEGALQYYLTAQGKKPGLCNFYLGVSLLTRYYLTGETDQSLKLKAIRRFAQAKAVAGFKAPEKLVSPKIMAVFQQATAAASANP